MKILNNLLGLLLAATAAFATPTQQLTLSGYDVWSKGQSEGISISSEGLLQPAATPKLLAELPAEVIWTSLTASDGTTYAATGSPSAVYKISPTGTVSLLRQFTEPLLRALALDEKGTLWVGAAPTAKLYALRPSDGALLSTLELNAHYVWAALPTRAGVVVATGLPATVQRVDVGGHLTLLAELPQQHITALASSASDTLYAGTSPEALLYSIDAKGAPQVLYQAAAAEVRAIQSIGSDVYFIAYGAQGSAPALAAQPTQPKAKKSSAKKNSSPPKDDKPSALAAAPAEDSSAAGTSELYKLTADGWAEKLWQAPALLSLGNAAGTLIIGEGTQGHLLTLEGRGKVTQLAQAPTGGDVIAASATQFTTSRPAKVYTLAPQAAASIFYTDVIDATQQARWGRVELIKTGTPQLWARGGFAAKPDAFWSPWTRVGQGPLPVPAARYVQLKVELPAGASLRQARLFYQLPAPTVDIAAFKVLPFALDLQKQTAPAGSAPLDVVLAAPSISLDDTPAADYQLSESPLKGRLTLLWSAKSSDGAPLKYTLALHKLDAADWVTLTRDAEDPFYALNPVGLPAGLYEAKLTATLTQGERTTTASKTSTPFVISTAAPQLSHLTATWRGADLAVSVDASDAYLRLTRAVVRLDGAKAEPLEPATGLWDSQQLHLVGLIKSAAAGTPNGLTVEVTNEYGATSLSTLSLRRP